MQNKRTNKTLPLLLAVCFVLGMISPAMAENGVEIQAAAVTDFAGLQAAVDAFNSGAAADTTIEVSGSIDMTGVLNVSNADHALTLTGGTLKRAAAGVYLLHVGAGAALILENITLDGAKDTYGTNSAALVQVEGGALTLQDGAVLKDNISGYGGGVYLNSGSFTMNGGEISGNAVVGGVGGGVACLGAFAMNGGDIAGNAANYGGGVYIGGSGSSFEMNGGNISGNTAADSGGGVYAYSTGHMSGGGISGNTVTNGNGGGLYVLGGSFAVDGGAISDNVVFGNGGGVYVNSGGSFTMTGGLVFGRGDEPVAVIYPTAWTPAADGTGVVVRWSGAEGAVYDEGAATDLYTLPDSGASAVWAADAQLGGGVADARGDDTGFIPLPVTVADQAPPQMVTDFAGLQAAINAFNSGAARDTTIMVNDSIDVTALLTVSNTAHTLTLTGNALRRAVADSALIHVAPDASLILGGITLDGMKDTYSGDTGLAPLVWVNRGALTLEDEAVLTNNDNGYGNGGGVYVDSGSLTMNGGNISDNTADYGSGVFLIHTWSESNFIMNGGEIFGNSGTGVYLYGADFTLNDGAIYGNDGSGVSSGLTGGHFIMNGGEISGNGNCGVSLGWNISFTLNDGTISSNYGGGVYLNSGSFTMTGGEISDNMSDADAGIFVGGVHLENGDFTMSDGRIFGNTTAYGGGVFVNGGDFAMSGGEIFSNTADISGGGVYIRGGDNKNSAGSFTMSGGSVSGNMANASGGGVYVRGDDSEGREGSAGHFTMDGGEISYNTANISGGGVYVWGEDSAEGEEGNEEEGEEGNEEEGEEGNEEEGEEG
ncbi:MAG: right-handed parallel beta-helix repeat-containing protein, partial [Oscillospiraceae bacterium]|nr:right-handed parallel beta-helix repeat-containing protein [Oscillospiraceae bacterium]